MEYSGVTVEDINFLASKIGEKKYMDRYNCFRTWLTDFIESSRLNGKFIEDAKLKNDATIEETAHSLNYMYWRLLEEFIRIHVGSIIANQDVTIHHFKMAATKEYIISSTNHLLTKLINLSLQ